MHKDFRSFLLGSNVANNKGPSKPGTSVISSEGKQK